MSTKDNWDDSSDDEEGDLLRLPPDPLYEAKEEYHEAQFVEDVDESEEVIEPDEGVVGEHPLEEYPQEEYYSDEDEDYEDELDDYDKKLGRFVSCR